PIVDQQVNVAFGDQAVITRLDGVGVGSHFVDLDPASRAAILEDDFSGSITYLPGRGPIDVRVYNPLGVKNGRYQLRFFDENNDNDQLDENVRWELEDEAGRITQSEVSIEVLNEQLLAEYGFSVNITQRPDVGTLQNENNGAIGIELEYLNPDGPQWFTAAPDQPQGYLNYIKTEVDFLDHSLDPNGSLSSMGEGQFVPYFLCDWKADGTSDFHLSPAWDNFSQFNDRVREASDSLRGLNNVDIVFTSDKRLWSRCVIIETANKFYYEDNQLSLGLPTEGDAQNFRLREAPSVSKESGADGMPRPDNAVDADGLPLKGMGWFPGYALDVETGQRLNIFFGENSTYDCSVPLIDNLCSRGGFQEQPAGRDMMWNPSAQNLTGLPGSTEFNQLNTYLGGQHYIYVTSEPYDSCQNIYQFLNDPDAFEQVKGKTNIQWASIPLLNPGTSLLTYEQGLIPNDLIVKLRVDNPYQVSLGTGVNNGYPAYGIEFRDAAPSPLTESTQIDSQLASINVVPNPYYGFSSYENSQFATLVKITNLPAVADITIYTLDGKFVRQYRRNIQGETPIGNNRGVLRNQIVPDVEWDLRNSLGVPVASGIYLIHVNAPGLGERVLKWFGISRQFDPSGL
ncbi:MAG: hypothetical protein AAGD05_10605, partial [Bacteroidota bacterium]